MNPTQSEGQMSDRIFLVLKIFRVELEEAENNILGLLEYYSQRFDNQEITNYVWKENRALLKKEIGCVKELERDLAGWDSHGVSDPMILLGNLTQYLKNLVTERCYPELVRLVIDRTSEKVSRYLK